MPVESTDLTWGPSPTTDEDPLEGTPYTVVGHIATGGMGEVYLADHRSARGRYVVKLLHAQMVSDSRLVDRMRVEAQAFAVLEHPSIVRVFDSGTTSSGRPYLVMERLRGCTLADELRQRGPLPIAEVLTWGQELLAGLQAAHDIGLVHRDVKLSNLFLHEGSEQERVLKVLDLGIAKVLEGASEKAPQPLHHPTEVGVIIGTPAYISPEAVLGQPIDHRADIYAAGIVLYVLICGRGPWEHQRRELQTMAARVHEVPKPPSAYAQKAVPPEVDAVVMKALARDPGDRYQSARDFAVALEQAAAKLVPTAPPDERPAATALGIEPTDPAALAEPRTAFGPASSGDLDEERQDTLFPGQTRPELALTESLDGASAFGVAGKTELLALDPALDRSAQDAQPTLTTVRAEQPDAALAPPQPPRARGLAGAIGSPGLRLAFAALLFGLVGWWLLNLGWR